MLSLHHECVFVHIPKCGGQSIEMAFLEDLGLNWRTRAPLLLRHNPDLELGPPRLAHLTAKDYVAYKYIPGELFERYFKFSVARNPYSRVVSLYHYQNCLVSFKNFTCDILPNQLWRKQFYFVRPQVDFLKDDNGDCILDRVLFLEELNNDLRELREKTGLKSEIGRVNTRREHLKKPNIRFRASLVKGDIPRGNIKNVLRDALGKQEYHEHWSNYYCQKSSDAVKRLYSDDFQFLGYES